MIRKVCRVLSRRVACFKPPVIHWQLWFRPHPTCSILNPVSSHQSKWDYISTLLNPLSLHLYLKMFLWFQTHHLFPFAAESGSSSHFCPPHTCRNVNKHCGHSLQSFVIFIFNLPDQAAFSCTSQGWALTDGCQAVSWPVWGAMEGEDKTQTPGSSQFNGGDKIHTWRRLKHTYKAAGQISTVQTQIIRGLSPQPLLLVPLAQNLPESSLTSCSISLPSLSCWLVSSMNR